MIEMIAGGDLEGYQNQARATLTFDVWHCFGEIAVPATIIHGELDATVPSAFAPPWPLDSHAAQ